MRNKLNEEKLIKRAKELKDGMKVRSNPIYKEGYKSSEWVKDISEFLLDIVHHTFYEDDE